MQECFHTVKKQKSYADKIRKQLFVKTMKGIINSNEYDKTASSS